MVGDLRSQCPSLEHYLIVGARAQRMDEPPRGDAEGVGESSRSRTRAASDPAICYYTSGTTKEPKAVLHATLHLQSSFTGLNWLDLKPGDVHWTTSRHRMGQGGVRRALRPVDERRDDLHVQRPLRAEERARTARSATASRPSARRRPNTGCWSRRTSRVKRCRSCAIARRRASRSIPR